MTVCANANNTVFNGEELLGRCLGKRELAARVLARFHKQMTQDLALVQDALSTRDAVQIAHVAHRIKGAAANVSAHGVQEQAGALEEAAREELWSQIPEQVEQLAGAHVEFASAWQSFTRTLAD
jgi:HPt (histidine-containing phosphotransfer) domain-containing protein|uniref:Hpt domain-containing protein n=1 Tax=Schlesneria paludicola TaxID=360056 RepID=A0A7C4QQT9_9PLAN